MEIANHKYRQGVGIMLLNRDKLVFVAQRIDRTSEAWQMPQGGIDPGESPAQAAMRELEEEIGTDKATIIRESRDWLTYDLPEPLRSQLWGGRYLGQRQKWFAMRFTGSDSDINIATAHPEFCQWRWIPMHQLPDIIVPFKRQNYQLLAEEFSDLAV